MTDMNSLVFLMVITIVSGYNGTTDRDIFNAHEYEANDKNTTLYDEGEKDTTIANSDNKNSTACADDFNVDEILNNEQEFRKYVRCLLSPGDEDCTPEGKIMKGTLPDALATYCAKCTAKQREAIDKVVRYLLKRRHDVWERLEVRYDPSGAYWAKYEALYSRPNFHL